MAKRIWKQLKDYPNYEINQDGIVRNISKGNLMKWIDNGKGYKSVKLYNKKGGRLCLVHRLVMTTFTEIQENKDVNHIDGNKSNNSVENLEWVTKKENMRHAHLNGLMNNKLSIDDVRDIKKEVAIANRQTYREIGERYGVKGSIISKIANGNLYHYI
jgi:hypothetical protein